MRYILLCLILILGLCGCSVVSKSRIKDNIVFTEEGVEFYTTIGKPVKMSYKDKEKEASYDSSSPSILRTITEAAVVNQMNRED